MLTEKAPEVHEVFAIRYARARRAVADCLMAHHDPHEAAAEMEFDYFVWLIRNENRVIVIDTGFSEAACEKRAGGREMLLRPDRGLAALGVDAAAVEDVVLTHLHYDHVGNFDLFPEARFHLQEAEMAYATGAMMAHPIFSAPFEVDEVQGMVGRVYEGRVKFHDGDSMLAPGVSLHLIGGHSKGLQCVRVYTKLGWIVLASDTMHLYANRAQGRPFPIIHSLEDMFRGFDRLTELADDPRFIVPGHDAEVMARYPVAGAGLEGIAVRLDEVPHE